MTRHVTVTLDSGAFFSEANEPPYVQVGYFCCENGNEIVVYVDGEQASPPEYKLKHGDLVVEHLDRVGTPKKGIVRTDAFRGALLRLHELYDAEDTPLFDEKCFHSTIRFDSGTLSPSVVKPHRFREVPAGGGYYTGSTKFSRSIAHDVLVEFELEAGEVVQLVTSDGAEVCSTRKLPEGWKWANFQVIADCPSADKFYRVAVNHKGKNYWLPNPEPPPVASP